MDEELCLACSEAAQPEHTPCCSAHGKNLCFWHYCQLHFVEVNRCDPKVHARGESVPK
jgi:hypothetical protein